MYSGGALAFASVCASSFVCSIICVPHHFASICASSFANVCAALFARVCASIMLRHSRAVPLQVKLIQFLLNRGESKSVLLQVCRQMLIPGQQANLGIISQVYDMLNQVYKAYLENEAHMMVRREAFHRSLGCSVLLSSQASRRSLMCESVCRYVCHVKSVCILHGCMCATFLTG